MKVRHDAFQTLADLRRKAILLLLDEQSLTLNAIAVEFQACRQVVLQASLQPVASKKAMSFPV
jgi:hypothetical protein